MSVKALGDAARQLVWQYAVAQYWDATAVPNSVPAMCWAAVQTFARKCSGETGTRRGALLATDLHAPLLWSLLGTTWPSGSPWGREGVAVRCHTPLLQALGETTNFLGALPSYSPQSGGLPRAAWQRALQRQMCLLGNM